MVWHTSGFTSTLHTHIHTVPLSAWLSLHVLLLDLSDTLARSPRGQHRLRPDGSRHCTITPTSLTIHPTSLPQSTSSFHPPFNSINDMFSLYILLIPMMAGLFLRYLTNTPTLNLNQSECIQVHYKSRLHHSRASSGVSKPDLNYLIWGNLSTF